MKWMQFGFVMLISIFAFGCGANTTKKETPDVPKAEVIVAVENDEISISYSKMPNIIIAPRPVRASAAEKAMQFIVSKNEISASNYTLLTNCFVTLTDGTNFVQYFIKSSSNCIIGPMVMPYAGEENIIQMSVYSNGIRAGLMGVKVNQDGELIP